MPKEALASEMPSKDKQPVENVERRGSSILRSTQEFSNKSSIRMLDCEVYSQLSSRPSVDLMQKSEPHSEYS